MHIPVPVARAAAAAPQEQGIGAEYAAGIFLVCLCVSFAFVYVMLGRASNARGIRLALPRGRAFFVGRESIARMRLEAGLLALMSVFTGGYWLIDSRFFNLPDPVHFYILLTLIVTLIAGVRVAALTALASFALAFLYVYEPRFEFAMAENLLEIISTLAGSAIALYIGHFLRERQRQGIREAEELRMRMALRERFIAVAVHELRTPVTALKLYSDILERSRADANALDRLRTQIDSLGGMVSQLLDLSKLESGKLVPARTPVAIEPLIRKALTYLAIMYPDHRFEFLPRAGAVALADEALLERVLVNVISNAAKYSPPKSRVGITASGQGDRCVITVADEGPGIPPEFAERVFAPFYQRGHSEGLGLGLYITKMLVERMEGSIWLESKHAAGTTFFIELPSS